MLRGSEQTFPGPMTGEVIAGIQARVYALFTMSCFFLCLAEELTHMLWAFN